MKQKSCIPGYLPFKKDKYLLCDFVSMTLLWRTLL